MHQEKGKINPKRGREIIRPIQNFGQKSPPAEKKFGKDNKQRPNKSCRRHFFASGETNFPTSRKNSGPENRKTEPKCKSLSSLKFDSGKLIWLSQNEKIKQTDPFSNKCNKMQKCTFPEKLSETFRNRKGEKD